MPLFLYAGTVGCNAQQLLLMTLKLVQSALRDRVQSLLKVFIVFLFSLSPFLFGIGNLCTWSGSMTLSFNNHGRSPTGKLPICF